jgi:hypothetical protein
MTRDSVIQVCPTFLMWKVHTRYHDLCPLLLAGSLVAREKIASGERDQLNYCDDARRLQSHAVNETAR